MADVSELMSIKNPVFQSYLFYCGILVLKVLVMVPLTARLRFKKGIFISPEDTKLAPRSKVKTDDPDIERIRRAHYNDVENIPFFFVAAWLYLITDPVPYIAINLFRLYAVARILHTFVYAVVVIPQPARALSFGVGYAITAFMAVQGIRSCVRGL